MTAYNGRGLLRATMDAMERCRRRLRLLLDERTAAGRIRQKTFARHMGKSEAWLTNVLNGKRGLRIVDLDQVADFFHLPVSELTRETDAELIEVTPTEKALLRKLRRMAPEYRDAVLMMAGMSSTKTVSPYGKSKPKKPVE